MATTTGNIPGMMEGGRRMKKKGSGKGGSGYKSPYHKDRGGHQLPFGNVSPEKAKKMLHEGTAQGHPLTDKQRKALGARASGSRKRK